MAPSTVAEVFRGSTILDCEKLVEKVVCIRSKPNQLMYLVLGTGLKATPWQVRNVLTERQVSLHQNLREALRKTRSLNLQRPTIALGRCEFETAESQWGACDGGMKCHKLGTVHDLESERDLCLGHFEEGL